MVVLVDAAFTNGTNSGELLLELDDVCECYVTLVVSIRAGSNEVTVSMILCTVIYKLI